MNKFFNKFFDSDLYFILVLAISVAFLFLIVPIFFVLIANIGDFFFSHYMQYIDWLDQFYPESKFKECKDLIMCD